MNHQTAGAIIDALMNDIKTAGGMEADLLKIGSHDGIRSKIVSLLVEMKEAVKTSVNAIFTTFNVIVNYGASVKQLVKMGKYDHQDLDINDDNFKTQRSGEEPMEAQLVHFGCDMSSAEAILEELDKMGLRPAELHELLAFGVEYPKEQLKYPVVALGSRFRSDGSWCVPSLNGWRDDERCLYLCYWSGVWDGGCRFLAFHK